MDINVDIVSQIITLVISGLGSVLLGFIIKFFSSLSTKNNTSVKNQLLKEYIGVAINLAQDTVIALNQNIVEDLKNNAVDGKLTDAEKAEIKKHALETIYTTLNDEIKNVLSKVYGDLPNWIQVQIDKAVAEEKAKKTT